MALSLKSLGARQASLPGRGRTPGRSPGWAEAHVLRPRAAVKAHVAALPAPWPRCDEPPGHLR